MAGLLNHGCTFRRNAGSNTWTLIESHCPNGCGPGPQNVPKFADENETERSELGREIHDDEFITWANALGAIPEVSSNMLSGETVLVPCPGGAAPVS